ncbi:MAG: Mrp/NBP35 family ATP-binding protein [Tissierella sp.]|uniref:Mrp/NBP35 family ATP-binding protein n=1 Tax=Tissierella sp. TaxID=41274 RepID=UPI003F95267B
MANCNTCPTKDDCSTSQEKCTIENNPLNKIGKIIGVMSGKGGVGKSTVSVLLAESLNKMGYKVGIMDSDITGPSVPRLLGIQDGKVLSDGKNLHPAQTKDGIKVISFNLMTKNENDPVVWRGPIVSSAVKQFWTDVAWGELDYLIIDMPPGTGDVALTVMDSIPINGIVMVSIPQDMVSMIVAKAVNMANKMNIDLLGLVENMSYIKCPNCDEKIRIYDEIDTEKYLEEMNLNLLGELPMTKSIGNLSNRGYDENSKDIDKDFKVIVENVLKSLK